MKSIKSINVFSKYLAREIKLFNRFFLNYLSNKTLNFFHFFEKEKNNLVKFLILKRGKYNRPFLHFATIAILLLGILIAPIITSNFPLLTGSAGAVSNIPSSSSSDQTINVDQNVFQTNISQKPRSSIIGYTVERGDTISTVAQKFGISENTVKWVNNLTNDNLTIGQTLKILPVSGVAYKVEGGDSVYSIAKKLNTNPQKIVDFPFNTFANPETFSLVTGEILVVPDGVPVEKQASVEPVYSETVNPTAVTSSGGYFWPIHGIITQYPSWYHMAYDLAAPIGTPIVAAKNGIISHVSVGGWNWGYGTYVEVDHGNGYKTLYAHMEAVNVQVGQAVTGGQTVIGFIGITGRTTGPHVHFEIRYNDVTVNPENFLR